jgi:hypothetical protein
MPDKLLAFEKCCQGFCLEYAMILKIEWVEVVVSVTRAVEHFPLPIVHYILLVFRM